jgi:signal peptidase I
MCLKSLSSKNDNQIERTDFFRRASIKSKVAVFEEALALGLDVRVRVSGRSMTPFIGNGDIVIIRKVPLISHHIGDILFFKNSIGHPVVHRFLKRQGAFYRTKGDAQLSFDEPIPPEAVLGKVVSIEKGGLSRVWHLDKGPWRIVNYLLARGHLALSKISHRLIRVDQGAWFRIKRKIRTFFQSYHYIHDTLLYERQVRFAGTTAKIGEDIQRYITWAAVNKIEGRKPPRVLGRSGEMPWFAHKDAAVRMSRRHLWFVGNDHFEELLSKVPQAFYREPEYHMESMIMGPENPPPCGVTFFQGKIKSAANRAADHSFVIPELKKEVPERHGSFQENIEFMEFNEDAWIIGAKMEKEVICIGRFIKVDGTDFYRVTDIGIKPTDSAGDGRRARFVKLAASRLRQRMNLNPQLSFDFVGSITPMAAGLGFSTFRHLRQREAQRLRALDPGEYQEIREAAIQYEFPGFEKEQSVPVPLLLKGVLRFIKASRNSS